MCVLDNGYIERKELDALFKHLLLSLGMKVKKTKILIVIVLKKIKKVNYKSILNTSFIDKSSLVYLLFPMSL